MKKAPVREKMVQPTAEEKGLNGTLSVLVQDTAKPILEAGKSEEFSIVKVESPSRVASRDGLDSEAKANCEVLSGKEGPTDDNVSLGKLDGTEQLISSSCAPAILHLSEKIGMGSEVKLDQENKASLIVETVTVSSCKPSRAQSGKAEDAEMKLADDEEVQSTSNGKAESEDSEEAVELAEKMELDEDIQERVAMSPENSEKSPENEPEESDCQIIESESPSSSKPFKLKQTRVHDWIELPDKSYEKNPSFKYDLPPWVDKFKDSFDYVKTAITPKKNKKRNPVYVFRCRHCIVQKQKKGLHIQGAAYLVRHLNMNHKPQYQKFIEANPGYKPKKSKRKIV